MCTGVEIFALVVGTASVIAERKEADARADILDENALIAENAAIQNANIQRRASEKLKARQRVAFLSSGVTFAGTPAEVLSNTARDEELSALAILQSGQMNADAFRRNAASIRSSRSGILLGGAAKIAGVFV